MLAGLTRFLVAGDMQHVRDVVAQYFSAGSSLGILRMKEHPFYGDNMNIPEFIESLRELLSE